MDNEDNEFFILVLGVLAAIIMVVSWWYTSGGTAAPVTTSAIPVAAADGDAPDQTVDDSDADAPAADESEPFGNEPADDETAGSATDEIDDEDTLAADEGIDPNQDLLDTVLDGLLVNPDLSVVTSLLREEGLSETLSAADGTPFTVFAPTNDAISSAASSDTTVAVLEGDRAAVLTYHVVPGSYTFDQLRELVRGSRSATLTTLQGEPLSLVADEGTIIINGNSRLTGDTTLTDSGAVHALDNVLVPPIAALNTIVAADPILFASGSADIEAASFPTLDRFIEVLAGNDVGVAIEGHTDSSGDAILNQNLSQSRARSVLNYLVANGIDESRLSATGFGSSQPVADNDSEEGRALNRRIEFTLN